MTPAGAQSSCSRSLGMLCKFWPSSIHLYPRFQPPKPGEKLRMSASEEAFHQPARGVTGGSTTATHCWAKPQDRKWVFLSKSLKHLSEWDPTWSRLSCFPGLRNSKRTFLRRSLKVLPHFKCSPVKSRISGAEVGICGFYPPQPMEERRYELYVVSGRRSESGWEGSDSPD